MDMSKTLEKLSSGLRINRAADDAAGLAVSEKLRSQIKGTGQAMRNAQDGISMIQTAEGALEEVHSMMQRMRELGVQASNDTYSNDDRKAINSELQALKTEVNAISSRTKFNGKELLTGNLSTKLAGASDVFNGKTIVTADGTNDTALSFSDVDVSGADTSTNYNITLDDSSAGNEKLILTNASTGVSQQLDIDGFDALGAGASNSQTFNFNELGVKFTLNATNSAGTGAVIADIKTAVELAANNTVQTDAGSGSANFQIGAGSGGVAAGDAISVAFSRVDISAAAGGNYATLDTELAAFDTAVTGGTFATTDAEQLVSAIDNAITSVNERRGTLGAAQNRLDHTIKSLSVGLENLSASESRIRDTDVATESANMVRAQILTQAGTSILSQANQVPQGALGLLR
jgi:flagellin